MNGIWFKELSEEGWLSRDRKFDRAAGFVKAGDRDGDLPTREEWLAAVNEPRLAEGVPNEVERIYEVARGAAAYGYFFCPLMTVAQHHLYRASEAAVRFKLRELDAAPAGLKGRKLARGASPDPRDLGRMVEFLISRGVVSQDTAASWRAIAKSWKVVSHPEDGTFFSLAAVLKSLARFAELINGLYAG